MRNLAEKSAEIDEAERLAASIAMEFHPDEVILFGSQARGDTHESSDIDLLVVLPDDGYDSGSALRIRKALSDRTVALDLVVVPRSLMRRKEGIWGTVHNAARREGKVLYAAH